MKTQKLCLSIFAAGLLASVGSALGQGVTGTPYLGNVSVTTLLTPPSALYGSWAGGAGLTSTSQGLRVQASGYGSLYYVLPGDQVQTVNASATQVRLTMTFGGTAADYNWVGTPFTLNDDSGSYNYGGLYSGSGNPGNPASVVWSGNTATWTVSLQPAQLTKVQTGTDHVYSFNLEFDPASLINGRTSYDVTFNSLEFVVVPEPSSLALLGAGMFALLGLRRRA